MEALKMAKDERGIFYFISIIFYFLCNPGTDPFYYNTLWSHLVIEFLETNVVSWGSIVNRDEDFEMVLALRASSFPFYVVIALASNKTIVVQQ